ncbi:MAG: hypothetical protein Kow0063_11810 [Anaerolineae bacterium]
MSSTAWPGDYDLQDASRIAVIDAKSGRRHTFKDFDERTNQIAHFCESWVGLRPGDCIGLLSTPSDDVLQIVIAAAKLGLMALILDVADPPEALAAAINQHSPRTVFYGLAQASLIQELWFEVDSVEHIIPLRGAVDTANFEDIVAYYPPTPPALVGDEKGQVVCFASDGTTWSGEELFAGDETQDSGAVPVAAPLHSPAGLRAAMQALQSGGCVVIETDAVKIIEPPTGMSPTREEGAASRRNVPRGRSWLPHEFK